MFSNFFFSEYCAVYEVMWKKYSKAGEAIDDNMAHALFSLGTKGHTHTQTHTHTHTLTRTHTHTHSNTHTHEKLDTHTHGICNAYYSSPTTVVARTRLTVTLYVHCPSCNIYVSSMHVS